SSITTDSAALTGNLDSTGGETCNVWFEYGTSTAYGSSTTPTSMPSTGPFSAYIFGLNDDTTYHFRACASNSQGTDYGDDMTFKTEKITYPPGVTTEGASSITTDSAALTGNLDSTGGLDCQLWFEYGTTTSYGSSTSKLSRSSTGPFSAIISSLSDDTTYHFRACASNSQGTDYGDDMTFTTLAHWTFMVYLDGDNNLEGVYIYNFNLMEMAANNPYVNVVVQFDRTPGYDTSNGDWTTTRRYEVKYDTHPNNFASYTEGVDYWELGELNMADPNVLSDFVDWAKTNYPADHYFLALVNHGGGWEPTVGDLSVAELVPTGILWDDTNGDYMSTAELSHALDAATSGGTQKLDVLYLDACLMQMIEVEYEIKGYARYMVGSEYVGWAPGPYDNYISSITSTTTASQLATTVVNEYHNDLTGLIYAHTMSAVDLSLFGLASVVDDFAQALTAGLSTYWTQIESSRTDCQKFVFDSYIDLYHFAFLIDQNIADATIQNAAQAVMTAVGNAVIAEAHENGGGGQYYPLDNAHGISIYFPASEGDSGYSNYNSGNLAFVADKGWD
ncbi:MAG: hypothetical protein KAX31_07275, partial [Thermoplasmata archaeon]|nr:hypothetical protein [Thermoplasmata archaeon]